MLFREYKEYDAKEILKWIDNERELRLWSADRYGNYPISPNDINDNYLKCKKASNFYPFCLEDEGRIVGHIILRIPEGYKDVIRLGFVIVDKKVRGKGYGLIIVKEAIKYAKEQLNAKDISLGVFKNNESAIKCYQSVGFEKVNIIKNAYKFYDESWDCIEMILNKQL